jgi:hypothetical protein
VLDGAELRGSDIRVGVLRGVDRVASLAAASMRVVDTSDMGQRFAVATVEHPWRTAVSMAHPLFMAADSTEVVDSTVDAGKRRQFILSCDRAGSESCQLFCCRNLFFSLTGALHRSGISC